MTAGGRPTGPGFRSGELTVHHSARQLQRTTAALRTAGATVSTLYTLNLDTGAATAVGPIGDAGVVNAITLQIPMP